MNKKKLFLWALYDFGNSIVFINFLLYFAQWLVLDGGLSDFWYNATFSIATILLLVSAPTLASFTDKYGGRKYFLNISTVGIWFCYSLAVLFAVNGVSIFLIATFFLLGQYFYQLAFVFYNPLIEEIADVSHRARASGIGQFSNALGQIAGLAITLPLAGNRLAPLLPSIAIFFVLSLPMIFLYKEHRTKDKKISLLSFRYETKEFKRKLNVFFATSIAAPMLIAFFFFNDALVTVTNNYSIYVARVFAVPDSTKSLLLMAILIMSAIGGLLAGWIADKIGILKLLKIILCAWIIALPAIAITENFTLFIIITILIGALIGAMWTTTRAYISTLLNSEEMGYGFSFYTLFERFATLVGPLTWGAIISSRGTDSSSYRIAMASMTVFVVAGLVILSTWKRSKITT